MEPARLMARAVVPTREMGEGINDVEVNVVDHFVRKGYRFKGVAQVLDSGPDFDHHVEFFSNRGLFDAPGRIRAIVTVRVDQARR